MTFHEFFLQATDSKRYPYQERLATEGETVPALLDVPTGLGKTAAAVLAWVWRRRFAAKKVRDKTPRRLVYCLPMRVLVEQTYAEVLCWLERLGMLAGTAKWDAYDSADCPQPKARLIDYGYRPEPDDSRQPTWANQNGNQGSERIAVHLLMGGEERSDWAFWPECDAILIGTQDMLLSRALNRGYAAGRARWPLEFAFLNNDCLWVYDEIQIMDTGLATSLQLDSWRRVLQLRPSRSEFPTATTNHAARPCHSL